MALLFIAAVPTVVKNLYSVEIPEEDSEMMLGGALHKWMGDVCKMGIGEGVFDTSGSSYKPMC